MSDITNPNQPPQVEVFADEVMSPEQFQRRCQDLGSQVIYTLVEVMMNGKSEGARVRAAENLLKYGFGGATVSASGLDSVLDSMSTKDQLNAAKEAVKELEAAYMKEQEVGPED